MKGSNIAEYALYEQVSGKCSIILRVCGTLGVINMFYNLFFRIFSYMFNL